MKLIVGSDHAGFELKNIIKAHLTQKYGSKIKILDLGAYEFVQDDDYPDYIGKVAHEVSKDPKHVIGIVFGGSGEGEAIVANRYKRVRCAIYAGGSFDLVSLSREHNNSNMLSLGARFLNKKDAIKAVDLWLLTPFSEDERHIRRIKKIDCLPHSVTHHNI